MNVGDMSTFQASSHLYGIKYWVRWNPAPEIYEYMGYNTAIDKHYFKLRSNKQFIIIPSLEMILAGYMRPFLIPGGKE
jgi:hypothetical protein